MLIAEGFQQLLELIQHSSGARIPQTGENQADG
jgi:hypothetical protein